MFKAIHEGKFDWFKLQNYKFYGSMDYEMKNHDGYTALYMAVEKTRPNFVTFLLEQGCNPNTLCKDAQTPMHIAMKKGNMLVNIFLYP